jgi:hypothetical protein
MVEFSDITNALKSITSAQVTMIIIVMMIIFFMAGYVTNQLDGQTVAQTQKNTATLAPASGLKIASNLLYIAGLLSAGYAAYRLV